MKSLNLRHNGKVIRNILTLIVLSVIMLISPLSARGGFLLLWNECSIADLSLPAFCVSEVCAL